MKTVPAVAGAGAVVGTRKLARFQSLSSAEACSKRLLENITASAEQRSNQTDKAASRGDLSEGAVCTGSKLDATTTLRTRRGGE